MILTDRASLPTLGVRSRFALERRLKPGQRHCSSQGFRILARRWKSPLGEIDLIARRRKLLIFVEVKARGHLADAEWSITPLQRRRIAAAAEVWLSLHPDEHILDIRFDAILVAPAQFPRHIPAAFDVDVSS